MLFYFLWRMFDEQNFIALRDKIFVMKILASSNSKLFFIYSRDKFIEQKIRVERTAACFGMKLHAERRNVRVLDTFASTIVRVHKTQFCAAWQTFIVHGVTVILA